MINVLPVGNYLSEQSFAHRLDPRAKIIIVICFIVSLFFVKNYWGLLWAGMFFVVLAKAANTDIKYIFTGLKPIMLIIMFTFILHLFITPGTVIYQFGPLFMTVEGLARGTFMAARLILLIGVSVILTATTSPIRLTAGLEKLFKPLIRLKIPVNELALMVSIALRFIPTFIDETEKIIKAQSSRSVSFHTGTLLSRMKNLTAILIPLFINSFKRAEDLAMAMETRCYQGGIGRTSLYPFKFTNKEHAAIGIVVFYFIVAAYIRQLV